MAKIKPGDMIVRDGKQYAVVKRCRGSGFAKRYARKIPGGLWTNSQGQWLVVRAVNPITDAPLVPDYFFR